jgi:hypothetical protein
MSRREVVTHASQNQAQSRCEELTLEAASILSVGNAPSQPQLESLPSTLHRGARHECDGTPGRRQKRSIRRVTSGRRSGLPIQRRRRAGTRRAPTGRKGTMAVVSARKALHDQLNPAGVSRNPSTRERH